MNGQLRRRSRRGSLKRLREPEEPSSNMVSAVLLRSTGAGNGVQGGIDGAEVLGTEFAIGFTMARLQYQRSTAMNALNSLLLVPLQ